MKVNTRRRINRHKTRLQHSRLKATCPRAAARLEPSTFLLAARCSAENRQNHDYGKARGARRGAATALSDARTLEKPRASAKLRSADVWGRARHLAPSIVLHLKRAIPSRRKLDVYTMHCIARSRMHTSEPACACSAARGLGLFIFAHTRAILSRARALKPACPARSSSSL